jgi:hypothetical protein
MLVVPRNQWGARYADGFAAAPIPSEWWLHHSAGAAPNEAEEIKVIRQLEQTGQDRFGGGMSYTWLVPLSGRAYAGHSMHRQGAHTLNRNDRARGICLVGNYNVERPTSRQLDTVAEIMITEWRAGRARTYLLNGGHRDLQATECPGDHAYALIPEINRRAKDLATGESRTPLIEEDDDVQNWHISGKGRQVIICPTGSASANRRQAWLSAAAATLNGAAWIRVFAQGASGGINDWTWAESALAPTPQNLVRRPYVELKDKTTHLVVSWDLSNAPEGAALCLETRPGA